MSVTRTSGRRVLPAVLAASMVLGSGAPVGFAQSEDEGREAEFDRVAARTAELRELPPLAEIDEAFQTGEELRAELPAQIAEDYPPEEAAAESRSWATLGLVPEGSDLVALFIDLLGDQVAGYYDPETNEMVMIADDDDFGALQEFTYSHEVVHALQDEHLGLGKLILEDAAELSDDAAIALTTLYEGDASVASLDYLAENPGLAARVALTAGAETPPLDGPPALSIWLIFPYLQGPVFVEALRDAGGWAAVDAAYADPPASTEQVLHPEKYLERDEPTAVTLPDPAAALGSGWQEVDQDTLGELLTAVVLSNLEEGEGVNEFLGTLDLPEPATNAAAGWDGDRYALWAKGDQEAFAWRSVWDSEEDARAFAAALQASAAERYGGEWSGSAAAAVFAGEGVQGRMALDGTSVAYVLAPTAELAEAGINALAGASQ